MLNWHYSPDHSLHKVASSAPVLYVTLSAKEHGCADVSWTQ